MSKRTILLGTIALAMLAACASGKSTQNTVSTAAPPAGVAAHATPPDCRGESAVWVIQGAKVYLLPGDALYGRTKRGEYLCLPQAESAGFRAARRPIRHDREKKSE